VQGNSQGTSPNADEVPSFVKRDVPLGPLSTIGIGGAARYFAEVDSPEQLGECLRFAKAHQLPILLLGGGSNILCSDEGFDGLVIRNQLCGIEQIAREGNAVLVRAGGGENWDAFVHHCVRANLQGVECLSGIPGSVGATPVQNVGAYGQEVADTIHTVEAVDRSTGEQVKFSAAECEFGYRMSRFKGSDKDRYIITAVTFRLHEGAPPAIRYGELSRHLEQQKIQTPTLQQVRDAVLEIRGRKAMVLDLNEVNSRSCGSFFTNPIVTNQQHEEVLNTVQQLGLLKEGETMPAFAAGEGHMKLSAAWLMERAGLQKGMRHGGVGLSQKHVLAIVNYGGGTSNDVLELVEIVKATVRQRFGVDLEPEPVFVGF